MSFWNRIEKLIPSTLFPFVAVPYWLMRPDRDNALIIPRSDCWEVRKGSEKFYIPSPRTGQSFPLPDHGYEKYFRVEKGDVVLDVGAGIREFTQTVVNRSGRILAVEVEPRNLACLRRNMEDFKHVEVIGIGVWGEKGIKNLGLSESRLSHSLLKRGENSIKVKVNTLDNIFHGREIKNIDFFKMDIEGAEIEALKGSKDVLRNTEKVAIECHFRKGESTVPEVCDFLDSLGFNVIRDGNLLFGRRDREWH